jgi:hypothetical protein
MAAAKTAAEKIADLKAQMAALTDEAAGELLVKIKDKRKELAALESEYTELTGKSLGGSEGAQGKITRATSKRVAITIEQIKDAISKGDKNNAQIATRLGCSKANVALKVKTEGKAAGIKHKGQRVNFAYYL